MTRRLGNYTLPNEAEEPKLGTARWTNPVNQCSILLIHYTADTNRRSHEWKQSARVGYATESAWNQEQELDFSTWHGLPVYLGFSPRHHVAPAGLQWKLRTDWPFIRGWDIGTHACVWMQLQRTLRGERLKIFTARQSAGAFPVTERKYQRFEIDTAGLGIFVQECIALSNQWFPGVEWNDVIDPAAFNRTIVKTLPPSQIFQDLGLAPVPARTQDITQRVRVVEDWLSMLSGGEAGLEVDPQALLIIDAFQGGYHWVNVEATRKPDKGPFSHVMNAIEYVCLMYPSPKTVLDRLRQERNEKLRQQTYRVPEENGYTRARDVRDRFAQQESGKINW
jgi:hypothetical protein